MRRWTMRWSPPDRWRMRYLPRRLSPSMRRPLRRRAKSAGEAPSMRGTASGVMRTAVMVRPQTRGRGRSVWSRLQGAQASVASSDTRELRSCTQTSRAFDLAIAGRSILPDHGAHEFMEPCWMALWDQTNTRSTSRPLRPTETYAPRIGVVGLGEYQLRDPRTAAHSHERRLLNNSTCSFAFAARNSSSCAETDSSACRFGQPFGLVSSMYFTLPVVDCVFGASPVSNSQLAV